MNKTDVDLHGIDDKYKIIAISSACGTAKSKNIIDHIKKQPTRVVICVTSRLTLQQQ